MSYFSVPGREDRQTVLRLAVPIAVASLSQTVMSLIDIAMVGRLGAAAVAAVGLAGITTFALAVFLTSIQVGVQTVVARRRGEGRQSEAADTFRVSMRFAIVIGHVAAGIFVFLVPSLFALMNNDPAVVEMGVAYLSYRGLSMGMVMMGAVFYGFYNAIGRTRIHMFAALVANTANVVLNYGLIFGRIGLPDMGAPGAGLATALASVLTVLLYLLPTTVRSLRNEFPGLWRGPFDIETMRKVVRLWLPASLHEVGVIFGFAMFMVIMGRIDTVTLAASEILLNIISFSFLPAMGFSYAAQTLVSEALGRNRPERAKTMTETATFLCLLFMGVLGVIFILVPAPILRIFTLEESIITSAAPALRLLGVVQFADAVGQVHYGALRGAGDVLFPALAEIGVMWIVLLPLAWVFGAQLGWGLMGGWAAVSAHITIYSIIFMARFAREPWRHITI